MILLYVVFPNEKEAENVARMSLEKKLAACVNILPPVMSFYRWPDEKGVETITRSEEVIALFKTMATHSKALKKLITENHSYECPALLSFPCNPNEAFGKWLYTQL